MSIYLHFQLVIDAYQFINNLNFLESHKTLNSCAIVVSLIFKLRVNLAEFQEFYALIENAILYPYFEFTIKLVANSFYLNSRSKHNINQKCLCKEENMNFSLYYLQRFYYYVYGGATGTRTPDPLLAKQVL